jgi:glycosyltransferase involved in cell wall biosynthesis
MRIVLDLATSRIWTRPPVGIVRTEQRFGQFLLARDDIEVAFCRFDKGEKRYLEIERDEVRRMLHLDYQTPERDELADGPPAEPPPLTASTPAHPTRRPEPGRRERIVGSIKRAGHGVIHRMPEPLRPQARETFHAAKIFAKHSLVFGRDSARWVARAARARRRGTGVPMTAGELPARSGAGSFAFRADDVYFSMGLDWEYNDLEILYAERKRVGFRTVLHCYDTIPVLLPHLMSFDARQHFARYFTDLAHAADRVAAISECSKQDLMHLMAELGGPAPPVDVAILGTEIDVPDARVHPPATRLAERDFVLCVSTIEARKNHEQLYHVWDRLAARHGDDTPLLVIVGMVGWGVSDLLFKLRTNPRMRNRVVIFDNLPDGELVWLYRNCLFTVFPSLYEGWGLPVVESLAFAKPCICSTAPAVLEAAHGMATPIDPLDTPAWLNAVETMWRDAALRERISGGLRAGFRPPTWQAHGEQLLAIAHRAAGNV